MGLLKILAPTTITSSIALGFYLLLLLLLTICTNNVSSETCVQKRDPDEQFNIIVSYKNHNTGFRRLLRSFKNRHHTFSSREERLTNFHNEMTTFAEKNHKELFQILSKFDGLSTESVWIVNRVIVRNATSSIMKFIQSLDFVADVQEEYYLPLPKLEIPNILNETSTDAATAADKIQWGVKRVKAPEVWKSTNNATKGEGIRVANIDTGVQGNHEALKSNHLAEYGWFDPEGRTATPNDENGHGTHTMGTICGTKRGIGVAPKAQWMACKGCSNSSCSSMNLIACGQWIACPTLPDGTKKDCSKAPHVISNSWGGGQGDPWYDDIIDAWHTAGIIPVFANGNEGPSCGTANSPGDSPDVISVGATDDTDSAAGFSSLGPSVGGDVKPDIAAPGVKILSAWRNSDTSYATLQGTSMATPHVSGVIALLLSANPSLRYEQVKSFLLGNTDTKSLVDGEHNCGDIRDNVFPNSVYGHGLVNAEISHEKVLQDMLSKQENTCNPSGQAQDDNNSKDQTAPGKPIDYQSK